MTTTQNDSQNLEAAIIARMIHPERADLTNHTAKAVLDLFSLDRADLDRMHELAAKNQDDSLAPDEKVELENYLRVSYFVDLLHAKARLSLKKQG